MTNSWEWSRNINIIHSIFMTNLHNQLWTRSGLLSMFLSPIFYNIWAATHGPFFLSEASLSLPWSAQTATISRQVWCNALSNPYPYFRYLLSLITSLLLLPTELSSQSSRLKLTLPHNQWLPIPYRLRQMAFNANILPTALHWFGLNIFFQLHFSY